MEELFLETKAGNIPLDKEIVKKYNLKKGTMSPFTGYRIVGKNGDFSIEKPIEEKHSLELEDDEIDEMENGLALSTSEMLDIASGVDSVTE